MLSTLKEHRAVFTAFTPLKPIMLSLLNSFSFAIPTFIDNFFVAIVIQNFIELLARLHDINKRFLCTSLPDYAIHLPGGPVHGAKSGQWIQRDGNTCLP